VEVIYSINNPREDMCHNASIFLDLEMVELGKQNFESNQGPFPQSSNEVPPLDRVKSWIL